MQSFVRSVIIIVTVCLAFTFDHRICSSAVSADSPLVLERNVSSSLPSALTGKVTDLRQLSGVYDLALVGLTNQSYFIVSPFGPGRGKEVAMSRFQESNVVSSVLMANGFPREKLNRFQVRVFKRDQIIQGPRVIERGDSEEVGRELLQTRLSAGDIIALIPTRE